MRQIDTFGRIVASHWNGLSFRSGGFTPISSERIFSRSTPPPRFEGRGRGCGVGVEWGRRALSCSVLLTGKTRQDKTRAKKRRQRKARAGDGRKQKTYIYLGPSFDLYHTNSCVSKHRFKKRPEGVSSLFGDLEKGVLFCVVFFPTPLPCLVICLVLGLSYLVIVVGLSYLVLRCPALSCDCLAIVLWFLRCPCLVLLIVLSCHCRGIVLSCLALSCFALPCFVRPQWFSTLALT